MDIKGAVTGTRTDSELQGRDKKEAGKGQKSGLRDVQH